MTDTFLIVLQLAQVGLLSGIFLRLGGHGARLNNIERIVFGREKTA